MRLVSKSICRNTLCKLSQLNMSKVLKSFHTIAIITVKAYSQNAKKPAKNIY